MRHPCFDFATEGENAFSRPMKETTQQLRGTPEHVAYFAKSNQPRFIELRRCGLPISSGTQPTVVVAKGKIANCRVSTRLSQTPNFCRTDALSTEIQMAQKIYFACKESSPVV